jgi:GNAT superfamily N-acetyltransferase
VLTFAREVIGERWAELEPLAAAHWREVGHFPDIPLEPHRHKYEACEAAGILRLFTVRTEGLLLGYSTYFVDTAPHHRNSLQAHHDALYLIPEARKLGNGLRFLAYCDQELRADGVQVVFFGSHARNPIDGLLTRQGYEVVDTIYAKRLDVPAARTLDAPAGVAT